MIRGALHGNVQVWFSDPEVGRTCFNISMLPTGTGASRRASRRFRTMSADCRIGTIGPASRPSARAKRSTSGKARGTDPSALQSEYRDSARTAAGTHPQPLEDRELPPLGSEGRHGQGPNLERVGVPRRHPAHRTEHHAAQGQMHINITTMSGQYLVGILVNAVSKF